ncbi:MAG TPA: Asp-tRNA(Asn)/Glu-tRNA(Gln) amidotransferase subunit GatC [Fibrobacteraceae bacterium]|jgi:aspartyl-tRNA(Asn)/glutamyl-tRNA(Gln) amidotransferase subunit C|nr:Asp-tRNA(Asn)/Glu-tRNA(Gln) amidotransferase subunit GatC [Fibrobacter sp.]HOG69196.1 Asp-tRNA(Asn)/Glu-tRNA(Gln) amidotransferase subunit GatC [Fibrobacteraceae bacterium]HPW95043.1 Asp-tRNA(Asn)/Glu-tRNA(Gln) amidotransferase subunit GatC [Fibrobacteraceae bacterium]
MLERSDILKLAKLSRLDLSEADMESVSTHLGQMLNHMEALCELDLSGVEPMTGVENETTPLREDVPQPSFSTEQIFRNAPKVESDHFVIPKVIGG